MGPWGLEKRNLIVTEGALSVLCTVATVQSTVQPGVGAAQVSVSAGQWSGSLVSSWALSRYSAPEEEGIEYFWLLATNQ